MRNYERLISNLLLVIGTVSVAVAINCLWNAYKIKQEQLLKAGDDPFIMVFTDKVEPENTGTGNDGMIRLNNQRLRNENRGWILIISGVSLFAIASGLKAWGNRPVTLGLEE